MNKTYHKFLIIFSILVIIGGVYFYFSNSLMSEASLSSSLDSSGFVDGAVLGDDKIALDIAFISTLTSLNKIEIDTTLFENKSFRNLNDNTVKLEPSVSGRINPFAPITSGSFSNRVASSPVTTSAPLEIKTKTAVLSGIVNNTAEALNPYFEYGTTEKLGQKTSQATVSLIGTFIANVTELTSKTTYFYKACAKINGALVCGEVVSFNTN